MHCDPPDTQSFRSSDSASLVLTVLYIWREKDVYGTDINQDRLYKRYGKSDRKVSDKIDEGHDD